MPGPVASAPRRSQPSAPSKQRARKSPARARGSSPAPKARRTSPARVQAREATPERAPSAPRKRTRGSPASKRPTGAAALAAAAPAAKHPAAKRRQAPKPEQTRACRWPVMLCGLVTLCVCLLLAPLALIVMRRTPTLMPTAPFVALSPPWSPQPPPGTPSPNRLSPRPPPPEDDDEILCDCGWTNYAGQSCAESRGKEGFPCWFACCSS